MYLTGASNRFCNGESAGFPVEKASASNDKRNQFFGKAIRCKDISV